MYEATSYRVIWSTMAIFVDPIMDSLDDLSMDYLDDLSNLIQDSEEFNESIAHSLDHLTLAEVHGELRATESLHTFDWNQWHHAGFSTEVSQEKPKTRSNDPQKGKEIQGGDTAGSIFMEFRCGTTCPRSSANAGLVTEGILRLHSSSVAEVFCRCRRDGCRRDVSMTLNRFEEHGFMGGSKYWKRSIWVRIGGQQQSILDWDQKSQYVALEDSDDKSRMEFLVKYMPRRMKRQAGE